MKLSVKKDEIFYKLQRTQFVHEKKRTLDIIQYVLIECLDKEIKLTATDLETSLRDYCPAEVSDSGSVLVNSRKLLEVVREISSKIVDIELLANENTLEVKSGRSLFRLPIRLVEEFPHTPFFDETVLYPIPAKELKEMIDRVIFAVPAHRSSSSITGLIFRELSSTESTAEERETKLEVFSIDIHRMVRYEKSFQTERPLGLQSGLVLPKKGAQQFSEIIEDVDIVNIGVEGNFFIGKANECTLTMRLLNQPIPRLDLNTLLNPPYEFEVDKESLLEILRRVSVMTSDDYRHVTIVLRENKMNFIISNPGIGTVEDDLDIIYDGPNIEIAFNVRFFVEAVSNIYSDKISIAVIDKEAPFIFTSKENVGYLSVLMPVMIIETGTGYNDEI